MKKSEIIKGIAKLYKDQFLTMATPGTAAAVARAKQENSYD